jgi:hypothetical protein
LDDFTEMKALLNTTDGNLASHSSLEKSGYIEKKKNLWVKNQNLVPSDQYGQSCFCFSLNSLEKLFKSKFLPFYFEIQSVLLNL